MSELNFRHTDLVINETEDGTEVLNIKGSVAFDEQIIDEAKQQGVKKYVQEDKSENNQEE